MGWRRRVVRGLALAGLGWGSSAGVFADGLATNAMPAVEAGAVETGRPVDEASVMAAELFAENRELRSRLEAKEREVETLQGQLAETMAALDLARGSNPQTPVVGSPAVGTDAVEVTDIAQVRVLEVNRDMQVAVVSGGSGAGMKTGMRFYVLRGDRMIAQLKLVDVRDRVAGGLIERVEKGSFPEAGDRVILSSKQDG